MAAKNQFPIWPPTLSPNEQDAILYLVKDWALSNGLLLRPSLPHPADPEPYVPPPAALPAPVSIFPTPFPRGLFQQACDIQTRFNALYAHVCVDDDFLERVIGGKVIQVDEFQRELYNIWKKVRDDEKGPKQPLHLGLFRSDYMIHQASDGVQSLKQVEFNTISSSFGPLADRVTGLHSFLTRSTSYPPTPIDEAGETNYLEPSALPVNTATKDLANGLSEGWKAYGKPNAVILFVVQERERNAFDQRLLEWELMERHGIRVVRMTFHQLSQQASLHAKNNALLINNIVVPFHIGPLPSPTSPSANPTSSSHSRSPSSSFSSLVGPVSTADASPHHAPHRPPLEVAVVYYRAGYTPQDYPNSVEWRTRLLLERSLAIKCPSVALQLAGAKKVQQVLTEEGLMEQKFRGVGRGTTALADKVQLADPDLAALRDTFTSLYPLDDSPLGKEALKLVYEHPERFVLKPQREGGGNNIYREDIPTFLDKLSHSSTEKFEKKRKRSASTVSARSDVSMEVHDREGYILMDLIQPPKGLQNLMLKSGETQPVQDEVISELGVYGVCLFGHSPDGGKGAEIVVNQRAGHLLRTKAQSTNEGGVATGFSVIDSPLLV